MLQKGPFEPQHSTLVPPKSPLFLDASTNTRIKGREGETEREREIERDRATERERERGREREILERGTEMCVEQGGEQQGGGQQGGGASGASSLVPGFSVEEDDLLEDFADQVSPSRVCIYI